MEERNLFFAVVARAARRRAALVAAGCSTYEASPLYPASITCLCCGMRSHNPHDISNLYCIFCSEFHTQETTIDAGAIRDIEDEGGGAAQQQRDLC